MGPENEEKLRRYFNRYLNPFMLALWRLGLAPMVNIWPEVGGRIMVIVHTGRKTGLRRYAPVNYAPVDGEIYCVAGFGRGSNWYRNLRANPNVEIWLPDAWWAGVVEDVSDHPDRLRLVREVLIASGFAARLFGGYNPKTMSEAELARETGHYPLLHIRRTEARTGRGGPGDLAWAWPLATMILLPLALFRRRRR